MFNKFWIKFKKRKVNYIASVFLLILIIMAIFAPYIAPYDPVRQDVLNTLSSPSRTYLMGTDHLGRDILSRIIFGARITVQIGLVAMTIATFFGVIQGLLAGYFGGLLDSIIMRFTDMLLAIPGILLAITIIAILGPGINNVIIAIGIASMPQFTRVVRGSVLSVKQNEYIEASRALGQKDFFIIIKHILPNIIGPVIVLATLRVAAAVLNAAALSFVGLGAQPPAPEWGAMLNNARRYMRTAWWFTLFPGIAIAISVLSINILGDTLRDIFDPRTYL